MSTQETQDILEAISNFAEQVDRRFDGVDRRFGGLEQKLGGLEQRLSRVESTMVTKHYLDDKLDNFRGDLVGFIRAEDAKILAKLK